MDYTEVLQALQQASLFDLYRLRSAIDTLLDETQRLLLVKRRLQPGKELTYFHARDNRLIKAVVEEVPRTCAHVRDKEGGKRWSIPFYALNVAGVDTYSIPMGISEAHPHPVESGEPHRLPRPAWEGAVWEDPPAQSQDRVDPDQRRRAVAGGLRAVVQGHGGGWPEGAGSRADRGGDHGGGMRGGMRGLDPDLT